MNQGNAEPGRLRRRVNDLVLAEMFLLQATIESVGAIREGVEALVSDDEAQDQDLPELLETTLERAVEPYTSRLRVYRELIRQP